MYRKMQALGSLKSFLSYTSQLSGVSILLLVFFFYILSSLSTAESDIGNDGSWQLLDCRHCSPFWGPLGLRNSFGGQHLKPMPVTSLFIDVAGDIPFHTIFLPWLLHVRHDTVTYLSTALFFTKPLSSRLGAILFDPMGENRPWQSETWPVELECWSRNWFIHCMTWGSY